MANLLKKLFVERTRQQLLEKNVKHTTLAKTTDVSHNTISTWLNAENDTMPNTAAIVEIAKCLNTSTDYLLGLSDNPAPADGYAPRKIKTYADLYRAFFDIVYALDCSMFHPVYIKTDGDPEHPFAELDIGSTANSLPLNHDPVTIFSTWGKLRDMAKADLSMLGIVETWQAGVINQCKDFGLNDPINDPANWKDISDDLPEQ